jgi:hypothetical protein
MSADYQRDQIELTDMSNGGWTRWSQYVLQELKRLNTAYEKLASNYNDLCVKVELLKEMPAKFNALQDEHKEKVMPFINRETKVNEIRGNAIIQVAIGVAIPSILALVGFLLWLYRSSPMQNLGISPIK